MAPCNNAYAGPSSRAGQDDVAAEDAGGFDLTGKEFLEALAASDPEAARAVVGYCCDSCPECDGVQAGDRDLAVGEERALVGALLAAGALAVCLLCCCLGLAACLLWRRREAGHNQGLALAKASRYLPWFCKFRLGVAVAGLYMMPELR